MLSPNHYVRTWSDPSVHVDNLLRIFNHDL